MAAEQYDAKAIEPEMLEFWERHRSYKKAADRNKGKRAFYFIDGPPYTSGSIHIGHAWNKALKDCILRYKRMKGFDAWSQPGFDMHGLPIEVAVEKKLGIKDKKEITEKLGIKNFIDECEKFSMEQMQPMITDFKRMGVWMDWDNPYMSIRNEYIEGAWWALSQANKNGYLYEGKKSMTWCPRCATALAKHELNYKNLTDKSVYVKLPLKEQTFLIIWTTTPWTLPFNLAVMAHPELDYVVAKVKELGEDWILAKGLAKKLMELCGYTYEIVEEFKGSYLEGAKYMPPFISEMPYYSSVDSPAANSVVMSSEYVDLSAGTGLVHTAPGCGPEDFEIGRRNGLPAVNTLDEHGKFQDAGPFEGLYARKDDDRIIASLQEKGKLVTTASVTHEYACCWRCETPVIYRATMQWFLAVEKLKEKMLQENERVRWVPDWAGNRWFESWLQNLQDWCISRQRFWGIPLPIWKCAGCAETRIVASRKELPMEIENLHRPWIDEVTFRCKCGQEMKRVQDVLDVWLDSGAASWAPLNYPETRQLFEKLWPADFILEGKDQIRGWFNSMICLSMVSHRKNCYKAVYMHGFVNDALGRKMSKSLKNTISPYEVIDSYGADTLRYYSIGGAKPGFDLNYNFEDMKLKNKNLGVFWNIHRFLIELSETADIEGDKELAVEERYMLSKLHSTIKKASSLFEEYNINETPWAVEELLLELSRTYIQLTREKSVGSDVERNTVLHTAFTVFLEGLKMLAPIAPFIAEKMYQNLRKPFSLPEESIHLYEWPGHDQELIDEELEQEFAAAKSALQALLAAREKAKLGIRWPLAEATLVTGKIRNQEILEAIKRQANIKQIKTEPTFSKAKPTVQADYEKLVPHFGQKSTRIIAALAMTAPDTVLRYLERDGQFVLNLDDDKITLTQEHLSVGKQPPYGYEFVPFDSGEAYLNIVTTPELEAEGYARELMRRIQNMRKQAGLKRSQQITLYIKAGTVLTEMLTAFHDAIANRVGAAELQISPAEPDTSFQHTSREKIREQEATVHFRLFQK